MLSSCCNLSAAEPILLGADFFFLQGGGGRMGSEGGGGGGGFAYSHLHSSVHLFCGRKG